MLLCVCVCVWLHSNDVSRREKLSLLVVIANGLPMLTLPPLLDDFACAMRYAQANVSLQSRYRSHIEIEDSLRKANKNRFCFVECTDDDRVKDNLETCDDKLK